MLPDTAWHEGKVPPCLDISVNFASMPFPTCCVASVTSSKVVSWFNKKNFEQPLVKLHSSPDWIFRSHSPGEMETHWSLRRLGEGPPKITPSYNRFITPMSPLNLLPFLTSTSTTKTPFHPKYETFRSWLLDFRRTKPHTTSLNYVGSSPCHSHWKGSHPRSVGENLTESWLVVDLPLWKIWKSNGVVIPNIWKNIQHVPNHQPESTVQRTACRRATLCRGPGWPGRDRWKQPWIHWVTKDLWYVMIYRFGKIEPTGHCAIHQIYPNYIQSNGKSKSLRRYSPFFGQQHALQTACQCLEHGSGVTCGTDGRTDGRMDGWREG